MILSARLWWPVRETGRLVSYPGDSRIIREGWHVCYGWTQNMQQVSILWWAKQFSLPVVVLAVAAAILWEWPCPVPTDLSGPWLVAWWSSKSVLLCTAGCAAFGLVTPSFGGSLQTKIQWSVHLKYNTTKLTLHVITTNFLPIVKKADIDSI